jgi:hypothetical protein
MKEEELLRMNRYELKIMVKKEVLLGLLELKMERIEYFILLIILVTILIYSILIIIVN